MSELLQKDQLVACWDREDCDKAIRIYVGKEGDLHRCRLPGIEHGYPGFELWEHCVPLEELAPEAFLDRERRAGEQTAEAVAMESALVQRLRKQIRWLCKELQAIGDRNGSQECPPVPHGDCRIGNCAECWEQASLEAVKEGADGTSEESPALGR